jgi:RNA polymerase sigma-70 factor (ECF subfamily)
VNSALQRARVTLGGPITPGEAVAAPTDEERALVERYVRAFERADVQALARLLADDVRMTMPPDPMWLEGRGDVLRFLDARVFALRGPIRLELTAANRHPAVALYERTGATEAALSIQVLTIRDRSVSEITGFVGAGFFPAFALPSTRTRHGTVRGALARRCRPS